MSGANSLESLKSLPAMPQAAHQILRLLNAPDTPIPEVGKAISREPSVTARIVAMANSAFFMSQRPVDTIDDAIVRLGLKRVKVMTTALILGTQFDTSRCKAFQADVYWYHAIRTAFCASRLVSFVPVEVPSDAAYLGGLLHNFGILLMAYAFPSEMNRVLALYSMQPDSSLRQLEQEEFGFDHAIAGGMLLQEWALPPEIIAAAQYCKADDYEGNFGRYVKLIGASSEWVKRNFESLPDSVVFRNTPERTLDAIAANCKNESEQLQQFADSFKTASA